MHLPEHTTRGIDRLSVYVLNLHNKPALQQLLRFAVIARRIDDSVERHYDISSQFINKCQYYHLPYHLQFSHATRVVFGRRQGCRGFTSHAVARASMSAPTAGKQPTRRRNPWSQWRGLQLMAQPTNCRGSEANRPMATWTVGRQSH